jgi:hypothetical protein
LIKKEASKKEYVLMKYNAQKDFTTLEASVRRPTDGKKQGY